MEHWTAFIRHYPDAPKFAEKYCFSEVRGSQNCKFAIYDQLFIAPK